MPDHDNDPREQAQDPAPESATPDEARVLPELLRYFDESFNAWMDTPETRRYIRESISGKVKRRLLMSLAHAMGCKHGNQAAGVVFRAGLGHALGLPRGTTWEACIVEVARLREGGDS